MSMFLGFRIALKKSFNQFFLSALLFSFLFASPAFSQETFRDQLKTYDRDDIHSIHKKLFTKQGRHEFSLGLGGVANHGGYLLTTLAYQYHLLESVGFEALGGGAFQINNTEKFYFGQASASFSPLYGKVSLFTWAVANFDIYAIAGAGFVNYQGTQSATSFMGNVGLGQRFFVNEFLSVKVEFRDYFYKKDVAVRGGGTQAEILHNYTLAATASVLFPLRQEY